MCLGYGLCVLNNVSIPNFWDLVASMVTKIRILIFLSTNSTPSHKLISSTIFSSTKLNSIGESTSPCLEPVSTSTDYDTIFACFILTFVLFILFSKRLTSSFENLNSPSILIKLALWIEIYKQYIYNFIEFPNFLKGLPNHKNLVCCKNIWSETSMVSVYII